MGFGGLVSFHGVGEEPQPSLAKLDGSFSYFLPYQLFTAGFIRSRSPSSPIKRKTTGCMII